MAGNKQLYIEQLFSTMSQLKKLMENQTQESHEEKTATIMQYSALKFLALHNKTTVGDLGNHLKLSKSSATQLIERLVKTGYVERIHDEQDRRIVRLTISPSGELYIIELKKKFMDKMGSIFSKVPDDDLKELIRIHTNLIESLQKEPHR